MHQANVAERSAEDAFRAEALRWIPNVARYARLLTRNQDDADDLAQETYLRAFQKWGSFRLGSDCRKWLFTICRNLYLNGRRRADRVISAGDPEVDVGRVAELYWSAAESGIDNLFDHIDVGPALEGGLQTMASEYREALVRVDIEGHTYADAASALGVPVGTVRSRLFRARRLLHEVMIERARDMGLAPERVNACQRGAEEL
jgi:RNA polymerase sigma-70 factor (ECF subfamily)